MTVKLEEIQKCITPETMLASGKLHTVLYEHPKLPGELFETKYDAIDKLDGETTTTKWLNECKAIDCFCSIGKILSCEGLTASDLDKIEIDGLKVRREMPDDEEDGGYKAQAFVLMRDHKAELAKYGIDSKETLVQIMKHNDAFYAPDTNEGLKARAVEILDWLRLQAE